MARVREVRVTNTDGRHVTVRVQYDDGVTQVIRVPTAEVGRCGPRSDILPRSHSQFYFRAGSR
jgi:hypothetical protein